MKRHTAYAVTVVSDLDLGTQVAAGARGRLELSLLRDDNLKLTDLAEATPTYETHGRQLRFCSSRVLASYGEGLRCGIRVEDVIDFAWEGGGDSLRYRTAPGVDDELAAFWAVNLLLPAWLTLEEHYHFLHASAVSLDGGAVLFSAPSWGGKSTLAERFVRHGHTLVSDDKVAVRRSEDGFRVAPSHHRYRPYRSKEDLGYAADHFSPDELPLRSIYLLRRPDAAEQVSIQGVAGFHRFAGLLPYQLFNFKHLQAERLRFLGALTNSARVFLLEVPNDLSRLGEIYEAVCRHAEAGYPSAGRGAP